MADKKTGGNFPSAQKGPYIYFPGGAEALRLTCDSTPLRPVRIEVRSSLRDTWRNLGQFVRPTVRRYFVDIGPINDQRLYRLSIDPYQLGE